MHKSMQQFIARLSWFLAVMMTLVIMTLPATAQAQQPASASQEVSIQLAERESFARVYAGLIEGIAPKVFESCVRWGRGCPTARVIQSEPPSRATLRTLRRLRESGAIAPGVIARRLQEAGVLSARCRMDTTIGSAIEQNWVSVRFHARDLARYPWNPRGWFNHRCRDRKIDIRPGRDIAYTYNPREPEIQLVAAVQAAVGTMTNPPALEDLRAGAQTLLLVLPEGGDSFDIPTDSLLSAFRAFAQAATKVPLRVSVIEVPAPQPRINSSSLEVRYAKLQTLMGVLAVIAAMCALGLWGQRHFYRDIISDMREQFATRLNDLEVSSARVLAEAERDAFSRGRADGEAAFDSVANFLLSSILGTKLQKHPGTVKVRFDQIFDKWSKYLAEVENRGRTKAEAAFAARESDIEKRGAATAVSIIHAALNPVFTRLGLTLAPVADGDATTLAGFVTTLINELHGRQAERKSLVPHHETLDYGTKPMLKALEGLSVEQVRDLLLLLSGIHARLPASDARRKMTWDDPNLILELLRFHEEELQAAKRRVNEVGTAVAQKIQEVATGIQAMAIELNPELHGQEPKPQGITEFTLEAALAPLRVATNFLWQAAYPSIGDRANRVDWANPPESIRALVEAVYTLLPPQERDPQITDYRERAGTATGLLNEFLARSLRFFTSIGSDVAYLRDKAEVGLRDSTLPEAT